MEIILEIFSRIFIFSDDLFDFVTKNERKSYFKVFFYNGIYFECANIFAFFLITFLVLKVIIKNFQLNWVLVLPAILIILTIYFGRNAVGYTLQIIDYLRQT
ncbi:hypothetical protein IGK14_001587 [Enterococcus sp. DIV0970a]|nr:hypothetical protein UAM_01055 [Enterococcus casseliflavus ATCC 49996]EOU11126.1 hypothetical protein I582_01641 [Enterococcus casseliflavus ATCC 49996]